ncbi:MAG: hypothetical protein R6U27_15640 [Desulfobacterales bacterium]
MKDLEKKSSLWVILFRPKNNKNPEPRRMTHDKARDQVPSVQVLIRLVPVETGGVFAMEPFYIQELMGMDT